MDHPANTDASAVDEHPPRSSDLSSKTTKHWIITTLVVVAALLCIGWLVHLVSKPKAKPAASQAIPVSLAPVTVGDLDVYLDALSTVTPVYTVTVVSRVAGEITEVRFKEGQTVKKNDLLAVIDPRPYVAAQLQAQGQLGRDEAALKNARIDLVRNQNSYKEHAIPEQQLATQQAIVDQDVGTVKLDQGNLAAAGRLFREFAITLSATILISAAISLSLTPMLCAKFLKHKAASQQSRFYKWSENIFQKIVGFYERTLDWVLERRGLTLGVAVATLALTIALLFIVPDVIADLQIAAAQVDGIALYMQPVQDISVADIVSRTEYQYSMQDPNAKGRWRPHHRRRLEPAACAPRSRVDAG